MAEVTLEWKVQCLEKTVAGLSAEVNRRMTIMERILTTRNEQFLVHKKLIEEEQALYQSVIASWADCAGSGSDQCSDNVQIQELKRSSTAASFPSSQRLALRAKRLKSHHNSSSLVKCERIESNLEWEESRSSATYGDSDTEPHPDDQRFNSEQEDEDGDPDQDSLGSSGLEKRIFVNFYSEDGGGLDGSSDPVWIHFLREEKGTAALCKYCDQKGFQQIYKLKTPSLSLLRRHLKQKHKIFVPVLPPPSTDSKEKDSSEHEKNPLRKTNFLKHEDHIYTLYARKNSSRSQFWRCRDRTCCGRAINRNGTIQTTREHSCLTTSVDCDAILLREKVRELAGTEPTMSVADVIAIAREGFPEEVLELVPLESLRRTIRRVRQLMLQTSAQQRGSADWT